MLLSPAHVREICKTLGIRPTKTLGQNFVHDAATVRKIVRAAHAQPGDHVLEVGPGLGSLTLGLLEAGARVSAIEIDPILATALPATVQGFTDEPQPLRVLQADALAVTSSEELNQAVNAQGETENWEAPTRMVANLPYNVAVPLVLNILKHFETVTELLVMVQTEVAQRLSAQAGSKIYGVPSVKTAWYGHAQLAGAISRSVFWPVPNVDSSLVRVTRSEPTWLAPRETTFKLVDTAFAQRRKMLRAALKNTFSDVDLNTVFSRAQIDPTRRGETLTVEDFDRLAWAVHQEREVSR